MQKERERERKSSFGGIKWDRDRNEKNKLEIMTTTRTRTHTQHSTHAHTRKTNDDQRESIVLFCFFFPFSLQLFFWVNFYFCVCVPYVRETTLRPNTSRLKLVSSNKKSQTWSNTWKTRQAIFISIVFFLLLICLKLTKRPLGVLSCYSATVPRPDNQKVIINSTKTVLH